MRTQHRIAAAVRMRLEMLKPYIVSWAQALSLQARARAAAQQSLVLIPGTSSQAQPQNALAALRQRAALVDEIWHAAGASAGCMRVSCQRT
jgi:ubiquinone biosynthesis protein COQ9